MNDEQKIEFLKAEYQEASRAFGLGIQFGQDILRSFLGGTVVLATLLGAAISFFKDPSTVAPAASIISLVATTISLMGFVMMRYYDRHLDSCRDRCAEIEVEFGGKVFSNIQKISRSVKVNGSDGFRIICFLFSLIWMGVFIWAARRMG